MNTQTTDMKPIFRTGPTSSDSMKLVDIVAGVEQLISDTLLEEFENADDDERIFIFEDICDYLNDIAPDGVVFGAQDGDGACFGFWRIDDDMEV